MKQSTVYFARLRAAGDPDRAPGHVGIHFGFGAAPYRLNKPYNAMSQVVRHGAVVLPKTND